MGVIPRVVMAFLAMSCGAHAGELSELGPLRASAGEAVSGYLEVPASGDNGARIPVSLVRGSLAGTVPRPSPALSFCRPSRLGCLR